MHSQNQHDNTVKQQMPGLLYTKIEYITVLCVSYKDNLNCRPAKTKYACHLLTDSNASLIEKHIIFLCHFNKIIRVIMSTNLAHT